MIEMQTQYRPNTIGEIANQYFQSGAYATLHPSTRRTYRRHAKILQHPLLLNNKPERLLQLQVNDLTIELMQRIAAERNGSDRLIKQQIIFLSRLLEWNAGMSGTPNPLRKYPKAGEATP